MKHEQSIEQLADTDDSVIDINQLYAYSLLDDESRCGFLFTFYWFGEVALFPAVSHVWDRLAEPRDWRCSQIGLASGVGGQGKTALLLTLQRFMAEALAAIHPLPERANYTTFDAWNEAALQSFEDDNARIAQVCSRYAAIMDGKPVTAGDTAPGGSPQ